MKKIATLAALTMAGIALASTNASAAPLPDPRLAETDAALTKLTALPLISSYAADIQQQIRDTPVR
ncbi:hypothetical protein ABT095_22720 [Kitasatospora sp. NPDC002227]|uniref:hypothetical protein n=1 Tax=Kitasatospora sp. NPDC002227 TaxID=3154773 RepID=UPI00331C0F38